LKGKGIRIFDMLLNLATYEERKRRKIRKKAEELVDKLLKLYSMLPSHNFLPSQRIPVLREAGIYRKGVGITRISREIKMPKELLKRMLLLSIAMGYVTAFTGGGRYYYMISPLGNMFKSLAEEFRNNFKATSFVFMLSGLLVPTRVQILYFAMKGGGTDKPDVLYETIYSKLFAGEVKRYRMLYLDLLQEMYYTNNFRDTYTRTPAEFAYEVAKRLDEVLDFERFKVIFTCVKGVQEGFSYLFKDVYCKDDVIETDRHEERREVLKKLMATAQQRLSSIEEIMSRIYFF